MWNGANGKGQNHGCILACSPLWRSGQTQARLGLVRRLNKPLGMVHTPTSGQQEHHTAVLCPCSFGHMVSDQGRGRSLYLRWHEMSFMQDAICISSPCLRAMLCASRPDNQGYSCRLGHDTRIQQPLEKCSIGVLCGGLASASRCRPSPVPSFLRATGRFRNQKHRSGAQERQELTRPFRQYPARAHCAMQLPQPSRSDLRLQHHQENAPFQHRVFVLTGTRGVMIWKMRSKLRRRLSHPAHGDRPRCLPGNTLAVSPLGAPRSLGPTWSISDLDRDQRELPSPSGSRTTPKGFGRCF